MNINSLFLLENLPYFTMEAVQQLIGDESMVNGNLLTALYRWNKMGEVIRLKKGVYSTRHFYELHQSDEDFLPAISAILIPQSYVSLEYVLQRRGILTDVVYPVTAITPKQTRVIRNRLGTFSYRNLNQDLYHGFSMSEYMGVPFARATLAKALFDFLYLRPLDGLLAEKDFNLAENLRLNLDEFTGQDRIEFAEFVESSKSRKMNRILKNLWRSVWRP